MALEKVVYEDNVTVIEAAQLNAIQDELIRVGGLLGKDIQSATIDNSGHLILTLTDGTTLDAGVAKGDTGPTGADGKSAYQYAQDGGYTGTEAEFAEKLAQEQLTGTTDELTSTQVYDAVSAGIPVKVQYTDSTYGLLSFTAFNVSESLNVIVSQIISYFNDPLLCELIGDKSSNEWGFNITTLAQKADIPTDDHINSLIDAKLGVIENGAY